MEYTSERRVGMNLGVVIIEGINKRKGLVDKLEAMTTELIENPNKCCTYRRSIVGNGGDSFQSYDVVKITNC